MQTTLDLLCLIHYQQGGSIHEFNEKYGINFIIDKPNLDSMVYKLGLRQSFFNQKSLNPNKYIFYPFNSIKESNNETKIDFIFGFIHGYRK